ncbi:MAG: hypothetical protein ACK4K4_05365, partial [Caldimicrobium sp.]
DIVNARLIFKDGTTCNLTASRVSLSRQRKFRVFEKGRYYSVNTLEKTYIEIKPKKKEKDFLVKQEKFTDNDPLKEELKAFLNSLLKGKKVSPSGDEALAALKVAFEIKREVEKNLKRKLGILL